MPGERKSAGATDARRLHPLLGMDKIMLTADSPSTISFYRGDAAAAATHLQARVADVAAGSR